MNTSYEEFKRWGNIEIFFTDEEREKLDRLVNLRMNTNQHGDWNSLTQLEYILFQMKNNYFSNKILDKQIRREEEYLKYIEEQKAEIEKE